LFLIWYVESKKRIVGIVLQSIVSRHENGPGRIYMAVCSSKAAKTTTGEVIKQEKVVKKGSCGGVVRNLEKYAT
jgi:hypothetical protein